MRTLPLLVLTACLLGCQSPQPPPESAAVGMDVSGHIATPGADPAFVQSSEPTTPLQEENHFIDAYFHAHRPRIAIYVNREFDGNLIPPAPPAQPIQPPIDFLNAGEYDQSQAASLDFSEFENDLCHRMSCEGRVRVMAPDFMAAHMTPQDAQDLATGSPQALADLAGRTGTDIMIQVQVRPTHQTDSGLEVLALSEALNTRDGKIIAHGGLAMKLPIDVAGLNDDASRLAAKLMGRMTDAWNAPEAK